jgi:hypothetical protein
VASHHPLRNGQPESTRNLQSHLAKERETVQPERHKTPADGQDAERPPHVRRLSLSCRASREIPQPERTRKIGPHAAPQHQARQSSVSNDTIELQNATDSMCLHADACRHMYRRILKLAPHVNPIRLIRSTGTYCTSSQTARPRAPRRRQGRPT